MPDASIAITDDACLFCLNTTPPWLALHSCLLLLGLSKLSAPRRCLLLLRGPLLLLLLLLLLLPLILRLTLEIRGLAFLLLVSLVLSFTTERETVEVSISSVTAAVLCALLLASATKK